MVYSWGESSKAEVLLLLLVFFPPKKQVHVIHIRRNWSYLYGLCFGVKCLCFIYMLLFFSIFLSPSIHLLFHHWHKVLVVNIPLFVWQGTWTSVGSKTIFHSNWHVVTGLHNGWITIKGTIVQWEDWIWSTWQGKLA